MTQEQFDTTAWHKSLKVRGKDGQVFPVSGVDFSTNHVLVKVMGKTIRLHYAQVEIENTVESLFAEGRFEEALEAMMRLGYERDKVLSMQGRYVSSQKQYESGLIDRMEWSKVREAIKKEALSLINGIPA